MMTHRKFVMLLLLILPLVSFGCASYLPEIRGTVVDDQTGRPIEGAVVLVEWSQSSGGFELSSKTAGVYEVPTAEDGGFMVPSIRAFSHVIFVIYKGGYVAWRSEHIFTNGTGYKPRTDFKWQDGNLYRLERFKDGMSYIAHYSFLGDAHRYSNGPLVKAMDEAEYAGWRREMDEGIRKWEEEQRKKGGGTGRWY